jgi:hypothetical protein
LPRMSLGTGSAQGERAICTILRLQLNVAAIASACVPAPGAARVVLTAKLSTALLVEVLLKTVNPSGVLDSKLHVEGMQVRGWPSHRRNCVSHVASHRPPDRHWAVPWATAGQATHKAPHDEADSAKQPVSPEHGRVLPVHWHVPVLSHV